MVYHVVQPEYSPSDLKDEIRSSIISSMHDLRRGDIVAMKDRNQTYRNNGKAIFDGKDIVPLYDDLDDYGSVPPTFFIGDEFPIMHWTSDVDHNQIVWIDTKAHRDQLLDIKDHVVDESGDPIPMDGEETSFVNAKCFAATVTFPLGTYTIQISKEYKYRHEYEDRVMNGEPLPVWAQDDTTVIYPWYDGYC